MTKQPQRLSEPPEWTNVVCAAAARLLPIMMLAGLIGVITVMVSDAASIVYDEPACGRASGDCP